MRGVILGSTLINLFRVGIEDRLYGESAIQSVCAQADSHPYTELTKDDLKWRALDTTCVETEVFYVTADSGHAVMAQVIYNSLA